MNHGIEIKKMSDSIPIRLKIARIVRGHRSGSVFATVCGAPISTYRAHERGDYELKSSDIIRYSQALNISIPWLLTGQGHPLDHLKDPDAYVLAQFLYHLRLETSKSSIQASAAAEAEQLVQKTHERSE